MSPALLSHTRSLELPSPFRLLASRGCCLQLVRCSSQGTGKLGGIFCLKNEKKKSDFYQHFHMEICTERLKTQHSSERGEGGEMPIRSVIFH